MKRFFSLLLAIALVCGAVPLGAFAATNDLEAQVSNTYNTARSYAGVSNFNGWCGLLVNWQLVILEINSSYIGGDGNVQFDNYKNLDVSTGGYSVSAYPSSGYNLRSALNQITSNGTKDAYNILVGFETGYGTEGALYGHTVFIHGIVGGIVYFCESFGLSIGGTYYPEGAVIKCSIDAFANYYNSWTTLDGVIHFESKVCSHAYSYTVTTATTCTSAGVKNYTCSKCGDSYKESIPAAGHNYVGVKTEATCDTAGYTTYTCSRCNDSYVEMTNGWSEWSTEYPTGIPESLIEQKTQYSTLEKEYSTSTDDTLEGWTSCGTTYSDWGTAQTTTTKPTESDTLRITNTTQTGWGYYHWCNNYNDSGSWGVDSVDCAGASYYHSYVSGTALPQMAFTDQGGQTAYGGTGSGASPCAYNFYVWFRNTGADVYTYSYQTRSEVNLFYRWSDTWSDWSDEEITSSEDRQVKTQTVYRYYIGELADHDYSYAVTKEPTATETGVLTGTCAGCFDTATETLPKLNTTDYTYSQIKAPSYTETGTGRYTWKTTAYGNFCFDVTLEKLVDANAPQYQLISASGLAGTTVEVYIAIKNNPGIISLRNTITYDASALELVKVEDLGLLAGYTTPAATLQSPYTLRWADSLATANNMANGDLVRLTFKISESALVGDYSVSVAHIESRDVNGAKVEFNAASGTVSVIECVIGDTDGDGEVSDWDAIVLNRYLAGWSVEAELLAADVDGDGEISDWDAIVLERYLAGWNIELGK